MTKKHKRLGNAAAAARKQRLQEEEENRESIRRINKLIDEIDNGKDEVVGGNSSSRGRREDALKSLRQIAVVRGLVNDHLRQLVWPQLVGSLTEDQAHYRQEYARHNDSNILSEKEEEADGKERKTSYYLHRDKQVVECDVNRCLFQHVHRRPELQRLINTCVSRGVEKKDKAREIDEDFEEGEEEEEGQGEREQEIYYYQGFHDIASVLLLVLGEEAKAFVVLDYLAKHHLRDCTRYDLVPVLESLTLVFHLLQKVDVDLHDYIRKSGVPAHFALTWRLTWFAHDMKSLEQSKRLFDVFIASHPLMPLYVGVTALVANRDRILQTECDFAFMHQTLQSIKVTDVLPIRILIRKAVHMYKMNEPSTLVKMPYDYSDDFLDQQQTSGGGGGGVRNRRRKKTKKKKFSTCASVKARLNDKGVWSVPNVKYVPATKVNKSQTLNVFHKAWNWNEQWSLFAMLSLSGIAAATSIFNLLSETGYF